MPACFHIFPTHYQLSWKLTNCPNGQFVWQREVGLLWFSAGLLLQNGLICRRGEIMNMFYITPSLLIHLDSVTSCHISFSLLENWFSSYMSKVVSFGLCNKFDQDTALACSFSDNLTNEVFKESVQMVYSEVKCGYTASTFIHIYHADVLCFHVVYNLAHWHWNGLKLTPGAFHFQICSQTSLLAFFLLFFFLQLPLSLLNIWKADFDVSNLWSEPLSDHFISNQLQCSCLFDCF